MTISTQAFPRGARERGDALPLECGDCIAAKRSRSPPRSKDRGYDGLVVQLKRGAVRFSINRFGSAASRGPWFENTTLVVHLLWCATSLRAEKLELVAFGVRRLHRRKAARYEDAPGTRSIPHRGMERYRIHTRVTNSAFHGNSGYRSRNNFDFFLFFYTLPLRYCNIDYHRN